MRGKIAPGVETLELAHTDVVAAEKCHELAMRLTVVQQVIQDQASNTARQEQS
jgi:hypothetical protein